MTVVKPLLVSLAVVLALGACSSPSSPGPVSQTSAISAAMANVNGTNVQVVSTQLATYGNVTGSGAGADANTPVWVVVLSGTFAGPAGPAVTTARVLIDARTGAFVRSDLPAPSGG